RACDALIATCARIGAARPSLGKPEPGDGDRAAARRPARDGTLTHGRAGGARRTVPARALDLVPRRWMRDEPAGARLAGDRLSGDLLAARAVFSCTLHVLPDRRDVPALPDAHDGPRRRGV